MGIRPVDFQLSFLSLQRMEQVQNAQDQHASIMQAHLIKELEKKKREEEETVNELKEADNARLDAEGNKGAQITLYNRKKKKEDYDEGHKLDAKA